MRSTDQDREAARKAFHQMNRRQKAAYVWSYYKIWFFAAAIAVIAIVATAGWYAAHPRTYTMVSAVLINADSLQTDKSTFFDDFAAAQGYAEDETVTVEDGYVVDYDNMDERSASSLQVLAAEFASGGIDLFISEEDLFANEAQVGAFCDLSTLLPEEFLEQYKDRLYFYKETNSDTAEDTGESAREAVNQAARESTDQAAAQTADPDSTETVSQSSADTASDRADGVPVGIRLGDNQLVRDGVYSSSQVLIAGIGSQSENAEEAAALLTYLLGTEEKEGSVD